MAKHKPQPDYSSVVVAEAPCGVLVIQKSGKEYFEFPAGKKHANDRDPRFTAAREAREEAGLKLMVDQLGFAGSDLHFNPFTHNPFYMMVFSAKLSDKKIMSHHMMSKEGERTAVLTWAQLNALGDKFSPLHRHLAEKFGVWRNK